jgi:hypothetical protein
MEIKAFLVILVISVIVILTALPIFYFFFNFSPTGYSLRHASNLCKVGCENSFIECNEKCENETCKNDCNVQRGKCLFYC